MIAAAILYCLPFFFLIQPWFGFLLFVVGVFLGLVLLIIDERRLSALYQEDESSPSTELVAGGQRKPDSKKFIVTRSTLFLLTLVPLSLFVLTSTGSMIGMGFLMGIMLGLIVEMWIFKDQLDLFRQRYLNQLSIHLSKNSISQIVIGSSAFFLILNLWIFLLR